MPLPSSTNDNFETRSDKFAISFPYKLGILLRGSPGAEKTSLIKTIAQHIKHHIDVTFVTEDIDCATDIVKSDWAQDDGTDKLNLSEDNKPSTLIKACLEDERLANAALELVADISYTRNVNGIMKILMVLCSASGAVGTRAFTR
eukprot:jgi/Phyca11/17927/fgenesh1_pg.PHYCAscaffold_32_\